MSEGAPLWRNVVDVLAALATVAVGFFAGVELWRARKQQRARTKSANVRVSAVAFALRRQIQSWLDEYERHPGSGAGHAQRGFDEAEIRAQEMIATGVDASPTIQESIREFYARFYRVTDTINKELAGTPWLLSQTPPRSVMKRANPLIDLDACVALLDRIVEPALQNVDDRLTALLKGEQAESRGG